MAGLILMVVIVTVVLAGYIVWYFANELEELKKDIKKLQKFVKIYPDEKELKEILDNIFGKDEEEDLIDKVARETYPGDMEEEI